MFSLELQYLIIDSLQLDSTTYPALNFRSERLRTAGIRPDDLSFRLVCSSWHDHTSQAVLGLFKDITLQDTRHAARFCTLVRTSPRAGIRVQNLTVRVDNLEVRVQNLAGIHPSFNEVLMDLLSEDMQERLPNLRKISFRNLQFSAIPRDKRLGTWTQVAAVSFNEDCVFKTVDGLWDWVALFAGCGCLSFGHICQKRPPSRRVATPLDPPRVHLQCLRFFSLSSRVSWIPAALASPHLRVDRLELIIRELSHYLPLLRILSPKLQDLDLFRMVPHETPLELGDGCCTELHTFTLARVIPISEEMPLALSDIRAILRASPNLSRIRFTFCEPISHPTLSQTAWAWSILDTVLAGTVYNVCIRFLSPFRSPGDLRQLECESALKAYMPRLTDLGALQFEYE